MEEKKNFKQKVLREVYLYIAYTIFLTLFLSAFTLYRMLILKEHGLSYFHYSYNLLEALILAKIILIGQRFKLGNRFKGYPLIIPTIYKTVVFSLFAMAFSIIEHFLVGFFHGQSLKTSFDELMQKNIYEILAGIMILTFFFLFFFAFLELGEELGENKLFNLFFRKKSKPTHQ